jgi:hypothetical protein
MARLGLSDRQKRIVELARGGGRITNTEVQTALEVAKRTPQRDLSVLVAKGVLERIGTTGKAPTTCSVRGHKRAKGAMSSRASRPDVNPTNTTRQPWSQAGSGTSVGHLSHWPYGSWSPPADGSRTAQMAHAPACRMSRELDIH